MSEWARGLGGPSFASPGEGVPDGLAGSRVPMRVGFPESGRTLEEEVCECQDS